MTAKERERLRAALRRGNKSTKWLINNGYSMADVRSVGGLTRKQFGPHGWQYFHYVQPKRIGSSWRRFFNMTEETTK